MKDDVVVLPVERACDCFEGTKKPPLRVVVPTMLQLRDALNGAVKSISDEPFITYRCAECHCVINIRVRDLYLA